MMLFAFIVNVIECVPSPMTIVASWDRASRIRADHRDCPCKSSASETVRSSTAKLLVLHEPIGPESRHELVGA